MIIRTEGHPGQGMTNPLSFPFSGGVFLCPNGYWSFALTLPEHVVFGAFFDTFFAAEDELLRQYPDGIEPCYFTDATPSSRRAVRAIVVSSLLKFLPCLAVFLGLLFGICLASYFLSFFLPKSAADSVILIAVFAATIAVVFDALRLDASK